MNPCYRIEAEAGGEEVAPQSHSARVQGAFNPASGSGWRVRCGRGSRRPGLNCEEGREGTPGVSLGAAVRGPISPPIPGDP